MTRHGWIGLAALLAAVAGGVFVSGWVQDNPTGRAASGPAAACVFHSSTLMPVADPRGLGYSNNTRCLVDASGTVSVVVRSKHGGDYTLCLVRAAAPWRADMPVEQTWLGDRDSLTLSGFPQRVAAIAAGPDGAIHMAWYGGSGNGADHQVHYARFTTAGKTRIVEEREPFRVPGFDAAATNAPVPIELWQEHAAIAVGADGTTHLAWEARDSGRRANDGMPRPGIAYATRTPDGKWSASGALDRPPYLDVGEGYPGQSRPAILVDGSGLVHVLCYGSVGGVQQVLHGTTVGRGFSGWKPVAPSSGDQRHVAAVLDARGRLHIAWREGAARNGAGSTVGIYYSMRETDGRWHKATRLSPADENASTPSVGVTDSSVCVAWAAWSPGAVNGDGQVDNGYPADNATVEGRIEVTSSPLGREQFGAATTIDPGPSSYPCWAVGPPNGAARPPLVWTSRGSDGITLKLGWCERGR
jgi:hypothetical protein